MGNYYFNNMKLPPQGMVMNKYGGQNQNFYSQPQGFYPKNKGNYNYQNQNQQFYKKQNPQDEFNILQSLKYVQENYQHLININMNNKGLTEKIKQEIAPRFFVIKSFTEEDIHKVKNLFI
jgi:hypothetical protein